MNPNCKTMLSKYIGYVIILPVFLALSSISFSQKDETIHENGRSYYKYTRIDSNGPVDPWGKSVGDINGDGLIDIIVGGNRERRIKWYERILKKLKISKVAINSAELVWYENPNWGKHPIAEGYNFSTDHEVSDVDRDGLNDVISLTADKLIWFKNPTWEANIIDRIKLHDLEVGDFDKDGDMDIVARNQSAFGGRGDRLFFYTQEKSGTWIKSSMPCPNGEGLKIADLNNDGWIDVIVNNKWYENIGPSKSSQWIERIYSKSWSWNHTFVNVGDLNNDGRLDIVLAPAEKAGSRYRLSWFEAPPDYRLEWQEHIFQNDVEAVHHFIAAHDMNGDGKTDIITSEMHQGKDPDEIMIYHNRGKEDSWEKLVLAKSGSHNMRAVDIDGDGDIDLVGANWSGKYQPVELWINKTCDWERHLIDAKKPWRSVFISSADIDNDGFKDIITGAWWYKNPGKASGKWKRRSIGDPANNMAVIYDFDGDGFLDVLASQWRDNTEWRLYERILRKLHIEDHAVPVDGGFVWARNNGVGEFEILRNIERGMGDFLQGVVVGQFQSGKIGVALSWHTPQNGIQMLTLPDDPVSKIWEWQEISPISQDEQLSSGDIDRDGDSDLLLGTLWLRNDGDKWTYFVIDSSRTNPDRNKLADMNNDGRLDAVVGIEAINKSGDVILYEQGKESTDPWIPNIVGTCIGPMSLDVNDIDQDGDLDIIVGEHNLKNPDRANLLIFKNENTKGIPWKKQLVFTGDEHHDGAHVVDIDNDGDQDILSIGWGHNKVLLYENKCSRYTH